MDEAGIEQGCGERCVCTDVPGNGHRARRLIQRPRELMRPHRCEADSGQRGSLLDPVPKSPRELESCAPSARAFRKSLIRKCTSDFARWMESFVRESTAAPKCP